MGGHAGIAVAGASSGKGGVLNLDKRLEPDLRFPEIVDCLNQLGIGSRESGTRKTESESKSKWVAAFSPYEGMKLPSRCPSRCHQ